jgi:hypothetical protein
MSRRRARSPIDVVAGRDNDAGRVFSTNEATTDDAWTRPMPGPHSHTYVEPGCLPERAFGGGRDAVCAFVNDELDGASLERSRRMAIRLSLALGGFNNVDVREPRSSALTVARRAAYAPHAVAVHTAALVLTLNRKPPGLHTGSERATSPGGAALVDLSGTTSEWSDGQIGRSSSRASRLRQPCSRTTGSPDLRASEALGARILSQDELLATRHREPTIVALTPGDAYHSSTQEAVRAQACSDAREHERGA